MALAKPLKLLAALLAGSAGLIAAQQWSARAQDADTIELVPREARPSAEVTLAVPGAVGAASVGSAGGPATVAQSKSTPAGAPDRAQALLATGSRAFAVHRWLPPAPPPPPVPPPPAPVVAAAPPPPAAPVAPPLPFVFVGMLEKGLEQRPQAFLAKGDTLLVVGAGDLLDNKSYRIETLSSQEIVMTYLPLGARQTLPVVGGTK